MLRPEEEEEEEEREPGVEAVETLPLLHTMPMPHQLLKEAMYNVCICMYIYTYIHTCIQSCVYIHTDRATALLLLHSKAMEKPTARTRTSYF